jgi:hypothetical protein
MRKEILNKEYPLKIGKTAPQFSSQNPVVLLSFEKTLQVLTMQGINQQHIPNNKCTKTFSCTRNRVQ